MKSSLSFFFLVSCTFNAMSNKLPDPRLWRLTPKFSYNSFYSHILVKNPLWIHFGRGPMSFFCMWIHSCPRTLSYKDCSFPLLNYLSTHSKNQLTIHIRFLSGLSILFYCSMSILKPVPHYCSFVVNFEIGKYYINSFVLFQDCLGILSRFHFKLSFSIYVKNKSSWDFYKNSVESENQFWECCHLNNVKSSAH